METVFTAAFKSDDELFHVEMYQWLLSEKQYDRLLSVRSPYLEDFLTRGIYNKLILTKVVCETMKNTPINILRIEGRGGVKNVPSKLDKYILVLVFS